MNFDGLVPAGGVVYFFVWPQPTNGDPVHDIYIDGRNPWSRPVSGLIDNEPVVHGETGRLRLASEYFDLVMPKDLQSCHGFYKYLPRFNGLVDNAPRIRRSSGKTETPMTQENGQP